jgi:TM2 domain-containing membrane protein YozV
MAVTVHQKSKAVAYLLWFFFGAISAHKFYLGKIGIGLLYLFTGQLAGIGWLIDLFILGHQVDVYNALHGRETLQQNQNVVVNVTAPAAPIEEKKLSADKQILSLAKTSPVLTVKEIIAETNLEMEEAEDALTNLVRKGLTREQVSPDGKMSYDFAS